MRVECFGEPDTGKPRVHRVGVDYVRAVELLKLAERSSHESEVGHNGRIFVGKGANREAGIARGDRNPRGRDDRADARSVPSGYGCHPAALVPRAPLSKNFFCERWNSVGCKPSPHRAWKPAPAPPDAPQGGDFLFAGVILTAERFLHFQPKAAQIKN